MKARLRGWLTTLYAATFMALFFFSSIPVMVLTRSGDLPMWFARKAWGPWGLWIAGVDLQVDLRAPIPDGPAIFAANHSSALDIWAAVAAIPRNVRFIAKAEVFRWPVFGWYMTVGGHVPGRPPRPRPGGRLAGRGRRPGPRRHQPDRLPRGHAQPRQPRPRLQEGALRHRGPGRACRWCPSPSPGAGKVTPKDLLHVYPGPIRVTFGRPVRAAEFPGRDALLREVRRQIIEMDRAAGGPGGADEPAVAARGFEGDVGDVPDGR